jgi:ubiquinone/menaquinone biosynthesis C-methylase UbiE
MLSEFVKTSLSETESQARRFYDQWIGSPGLRSMLGRLIFRLSGAVYGPTFVRAARLTADENVLEVGCGMGTILSAAQVRLHSMGSHLGVDLSLEMVARGRARILSCRQPTSVELVVGSGLALPVGDSLFDVVLLSHVIKYLTDDQLSQALWEARRVLRPRGRIVLWEFHPVLNSSVTQLILRCCQAQRLRGPDELKAFLVAAGFREPTSFRVITPWLPWSNVAFTGWLDL